MTALQLEDIVLPSVISMLFAWQMATFARRTGKARAKFKVPYPSMTGDEAFMRFYRAQQNTLEFAPIIFPLLWAASLFFHQVPAAIVGLVYWYGRREYFEGYIIAVKDRLYGFGICVHAIRALMGMAMAGFVHLGLVTYADIDLKQMIRERLNI